jgi:hypothetical protein
MPKLVLSMAQQRSLLRALPSTRRMAIKKHCVSCQMKGEGIKNIVDSVKKLLSSLNVKFGSTVLKEFILPFIKSKISGGALKLPGGALRLSGGSLRLAGQRGKGKRVKK